MKNPSNAQNPVFTEDMPERRANYRARWQQDLRFMRMNPGNAKSPHITHEIGEFLLGLYDRVSQQYAALSMEEMQQKRTDKMESQLWRHDVYETANRLVPLIAKEEMRLAEALIPGADAKAIIDYIAKHIWNECDVPPRTAYTLACNAAKHAGRAVVTCMEGEAFSQRMKDEQWRLRRIRARDGSIKPDLDSPPIPADIQKLLVDLFYRMSDHISMLAELQSLSSIDVPLWGANPGDNGLPLSGQKSMTSFSPLIAYLDVEDTRRPFEKSDSHVKEHLPETIKTRHVEAIKFQPLIACTHAFINHPVVAEYGESLSPKDKKSLVRNIIGSVVHQVSRTALHNDFSKELRSTDKGESVFHLMINEMFDEQDKKVLLPLLDVARLTMHKQEGTATINIPVTPSPRLDMHEARETLADLTCFALASVLPECSTIQSQFDGDVYAVTLTFTGEGTSTPVQDMQHALAKEIATFLPAKRRGR